MTPSDPPRIYVACLAAYNNGTLHGEWLDADEEPETLDEAVREMLRRSPEPGAEEWAIHDSEGFSPYHLHEYDNLKDVSEIAQGIVEHGSIFAALLDHHGSLDDTRTAITEEYCGAWRSLDEYVEDTIRECHDIPDYLDYYINWAAIGRDMQTNGELYTLELDGAIHVFHNR